MFPLHLPLTEASARPFLWILPVNAHKRHYEKFADGTVKDIEDEIPFDVPEGWGWCRLGEVLKIQSGDAIKVRQNQKGEYPVYGGNGVTGYYSDFNVTEPTIIIGRVGFNCGSVHISEKNRG